MSNTPTEFYQWRDRQGEISRRIIARREAAKPRPPAPCTDETSPNDPIMRMMAGIEAAEARRYTVHFANGEYQTVTADNKTDARRKAILQVGNVSRITGVCNGND